jgi:hypothetical protein
MTPTTLPEPPVGRADAPIRLPAFLHHFADGATFPSFHAELPAAESTEPIVVELLPGYEARPPRRRLTPLVYGPGIHRGCPLFQAIARGVASVIEPEGEPHAG